MHVIKQRDPIDVLVIFETERARPYSFKWAGRKFVVEKINLSYAKRMGNGKHIFYSVTAEGNYFKLVFDTNEMQWWVEEVHEQ